jgi:hypothetical protein
MSASDPGSPSTDSSLPPPPPIGVEEFGYTVCMYYEPGKMAEVLSVNPGRGLPSSSGGDVAYDLYKRLVKVRNDEKTGRKQTRKSKKKNRSKKTLKRF